MPDIGIPGPYAWLFLGPLYWRATLALIALFAVMGALMSRNQVRLLCFGVALLLSADILLLFLLPGRTD